MSRAQVEEWPFYKWSNFSIRQLMRGDSKSVLNMKMALHSLVSLEMWGVEGLIMASTVVYQS